MKWYSLKKKENRKTYGGLVLAKPITAKTRRGTILLLVPQLKSVAYDYEIKGYNWLNIRNGSYNSCCCFSTVEEAIDEYSSYELANTSLHKLLK